LKLFTKHLDASGKTWREHATFAALIGIKMAISSCYFLLHGLMPFIPMPNCYNLESMSAYLLKRDDEAKKTKINQF